MLEVYFNFPEVSEKNKEKNIIQNTASDPKIHIGTFEYKEYIVFNRTAKFGVQNIYFFMFLNMVLYLSEILGSCGGEYESDCLLMLRHVAP